MIVPATAPEAEPQKVTPAWPTGSTVIASLPPLFGMLSISQAPVPR